MQPVKSRWLHSINKELRSGESKQVHKDTFVTKLGLPTLNPNLETSSQLLCYHSSQNFRGKTKPDHVCHARGIHKGWINVEWKLESCSQLGAEPDGERNQVSAPAFFPQPHLTAIYFGSNLDRRSCQAHMEKSDRMSDVGLKSLASKINLSKPHLLSGMLPAQWGGWGRKGPLTMT